MGFYLRKSISVGPLRFNLSKSGVGVSAGMPGFRVGMGPRGNYVHMGRGGLYYRATLSEPGQIEPALRPSPPLPSGRSEVPPGTHEALVEIESGDVARMIDCSSEALLDELNQKAKKLRLLPWIVIAAIVVLLLGLDAAWPNWLLVAIGVAAAVAMYFAHVRDTLAKTAVLFYDLDSAMAAEYDALHKSAVSLAACSSAWHIESSGKVLDQKYHAGAHRVVSRKLTAIRIAEPPRVKTNIETVFIKVGRQDLHFFPDRVLVFDGSSVGAIGYQQLSLAVQRRQFVEDGPVPADAKVVDQTWRYVNKSGGPDRRFKDNKQIPVCLYEELALTSATGLNELIQLSRCGPAESFAAAVSSLGKFLPRERGANAA